MKQIVMREGERFNTKAVIKQVAQFPSEGQRMNLEDMDRRIKVMRATEKANGSLLLEDADYNALKAAFQATSWTIADEELSQIIHDVMDAKEPPSVAE